MSELKTVSHVIVSALSSKIVYATKIVERISLCLYINISINESRLYININYKFVHKDRLKTRRLRIKVYKNTFLYLKI